MISAQEARRSGPIADYIAVSHELQNQLWKSIYARKTSVDLCEVCKAAGLDYDHADTEPWFTRLCEELEHEGYTLSSEGIMSW